MSAQNTKDIHVPTGLDLNPKHPGTVRLSKRAGIIFVLIVGIVLALVAFGIYGRHQPQSRRAHGPSDDRNIVAATDVGRQIVQEMSGHGAKAEEKLELQPPAPAKPTQAPIKTEPIKVKTRQPVLYHSTPQTGYHESTPEDKRLQLEYQREQEAIAAPTKVSLPSSALGVQTVAANQASPGLSQIESLLQGLLGTTSAAAKTGPARPANPDTQTKTALAEVPQKLVVNRMLSAGRFEIKSGWNIPAILEQDINSDLPGQIRALVRENVYDTASGYWLLIPQGARLIGSYNSEVAYGQEAVQVAWNRIIYPDGSSIDLIGMAGQDASGASGFRDDVDHHYKRLIGMGLLTSAFSAGFQLSQSQHGSTLDYPSAAETAGTAVGQQMSQSGIEVTRRNLSVPPTIKIRAGYRFNVRVNRDLVFDRPYQ
jgi:type IV secretion system protein VirB10